MAVLLILFVCHVHSGSHQYSWFSRISSTVANRYRKCTSLLKRSVSITSISYAIKLVNVAFQSVPCIHAEWAILGGRVRNAGLPVISGNTLLTVACEYCRRAERLRLSRRARDTAATMLHHSRHRGESATKTIKFFVAHTVNYVICNTHTRIDWVPLNFTPVIQQNYRKPGRKFEKLFCVVDRLSCQLELSKSETSQFRSDLVFYIVNYMHLIFFHGG